MQWLDVAVIIGYLILTAVVGIVASRRVKETSDYALAGRRLGYVLTIGSLVATMIGASSTMGKAAMAYEHGVGMMWDGVAIVLGYILFALFAGKLRKSGIWTLTEVLEKRYGPTAKTVGAWVLFLSVMAVYGAQLVAVGVVFKLVGAQVGLSHTAALLLASVVLVAYTFLGGMIAVAYTDLVQFLIMLPVIGLVLPLAIFREAPIASLSVSLPANMLDFWHGIPLMFILSLMLTFTPGTAADPTIWQRGMSASSDRVAKRSPLVAAAFYLYWSFVVVGLGLAGYMLYPNIASQFGTADALIPVMMVDYLPVGLTGLGLTALLAIAMSTSSSTLLICGVVGTRDILPSFRRGQTLAPAAELRWSRIITLATGVLGIVFALTMGGIFEILMLAYGIFISGMFVPLMAGLFWRRATRQGALVSSILATVTLVALYAVPTAVDPIVGSMAVSLVTMVVISLFTYHAENATMPLLSKEALAAHEEVAATTHGH